MRRSAKGEREARKRRTGGERQAVRATGDHAGWIAGFDDAVGLEGEGVVEGEMQGRVGVGGVGNEAEGQTWRGAQFLAVAIGGR